MTTNKCRHIRCELPSEICHIQMRTISKRKKKNRTKLVAELNSCYSKWLHTTKRLYDDKTMPKTMTVRIQPQNHRMMCHLMRIVCEKCVRRCVCAIFDANCLVHLILGRRKVHNFHRTIDITNVSNMCPYPCPIRSHLFAYQSSKRRKKKTRQHAVLCHLTGFKFVRSEIGKTTITFSFYYELLLWNCCFFFLLRRIFDNKTNDFGTKTSRHKP